MFIRVNRILIVSVIFIGSIVLAACNGPVARNSTLAIARQNSSVLPDAAVVIPLGEDVFKPFILVVQPGTSVVWHNADRVAHTLVTTSKHTSFLNPEPFSLRLAASQTALFTFHTPGLYDYFDSTQATWNSADQRVTANRGTPNYPLAMEGIIWVQGPISGLHATAANPIPGKDEFSADFIAITPGGSVSWHNTDTDDHFVSLVPGWSRPVNPVDLGVIQIRGTQAHPGGETKTLTFSTPGLYYYYCSAHVSIDGLWKRALAHKDASEMPIPMEGFILVTQNLQ